MWTPEPCFSHCLWWSLFLFPSPPWTESWSCCTWLYYACRVPSASHHGRLTGQDWSVPWSPRWVPWPTVWSHTGAQCSMRFQACTLLYRSQPLHDLAPDHRQRSALYCLWVSLSILSMTWGQSTGKRVWCTPVAKSCSTQSTWNVTFLSLQREGTRFWVISPTQIFSYIICILKSDRSRLPECLEEKSAACFLPSPCLCDWMTAPSPRVVRRAFLTVINRKSLRGARKAANPWNQKLSEIRMAVVENIMALTNEEW